MLLVDAREQATTIDFTALCTEQLGAPGYTPRCSIRASRADTGAPTEVRRHHR